MLLVQDPVVAAVDPCAIMQSQAVASSSTTQTVIQMSGSNFGVDIGFAVVNLTTNFPNTNPYDCCLLMLLGVDDGALC